MGFSIFIISTAQVEAFNIEWGHGPLPARNYTPVAMHFLNMVATPAKTLSKNQLQITSEFVETNTVLLEETSQVDAVIKHENLRFSLNVDYGVSDRFQIGIEVPAFYRFDGFLNSFVESVEDAFSDLNPSRLKLLNNEFDYRVDINGQRIIEGEKDDIGLGDMVLNTRWVAIEEGERRPAVALRFALKVPTGDTAKAFGSGDPDVGLGLAVQKGLGKRWVLYSNVNVVFPTGDFKDTGLDLEPFYSGMIAIEYRPILRFSILTQFEYFSMPFHGLNSPILEDGVGEISAGISYLIRENFLVRIGGTENFTDPFPDASAADFSFLVTLGYQFKK